MPLLRSSAKAVRSATTIVDVGAATAPSSGQVLMATGSTAATWQTPSSGGSSTAVDPSTSTAGWISYTLEKSDVSSATTLTNYGGVLEFTTSGAGYYQYFIPDYIGNTNDCLQMSTMKRVIIKLMYQNYQGANYKGFGLASTTGDIYKDTSTAGARACFLWNSATNLYAVTSDGTGTPTSTTLTAPSANTWNEYVLDYDKTNSSCKFYLNGTLVATHTTELPATADRCKFMFGVSAASNNYRSSPPIVSVKLT